MRGAVVGVAQGFEVFAAPPLAGIHPDLRDEGRVLPADRHLQPLHPLGGLDAVAVLPFPRLYWTLSKSTKQLARSILPKYYSQGMN